MLRGRDPVLDDLLELLGGHARVRGHDDFDDRLFPAGERAFHVALEQRGEGFLVFPLRMLRRERLHAVEREEKLEIHRLLAPERAVVVERGDALGDRDKVRRAFLRDLRDEVDDGLFGRAVVPRRQRITRRLGSGGTRAKCQECHRKNNPVDDSYDVWFRSHVVVLPGFCCLANSLLSPGKSRAASRETARVSRSSQWVYLLIGRGTMTTRAGRIVRGTRGSPWNRQRRHLERLTSVYPQQPPHPARSLPKS